MEKTEAITLKSIPYKDQKKIIKVFTKDLGIISLMAKTNKKSSINSNFTVFDALLKKGRSDIYFLQDFTVLDENLLLREDLEFINTAYFLGKTILSTQFFQKESSSLYMLFKAYIKNIPKIKALKALKLSFLLKLLKYEGLLDFKTTCNTCKDVASSIYKGETFCSQHSNSFSYVFSKKEFSIIEKLLFSKKFLDLNNLEISNILEEKIKSIFKEQL